MAESTSREKAIAKKESTSKKLLIRSILQGLTPRVPVARARIVI